MAKIFDTKIDLRVSGIATPEADNEVANKKYVDDQVESAKIPVEVATNSLFGDTLSQNFTKVGVLSVNEDDEFSVAPQGDGGYTLSFNDGITDGFGRLGDLISIYDGTNTGTYYIYHLTHDLGADRFDISDVINGTDVIADVDNDTDGFQFYIDEDFIAGREIQNDSITLSKTDLPNGSDGQVLTSTGSDWGWEDLPNEFEAFNNAEGKGFNDVAAADQNYELVTGFNAVDTESKFRLLENLGSGSYDQIDFMSGADFLDVGVLGSTVKISDGTDTGLYRVISFKTDSLRLFPTAYAGTDVLDGVSSGSGSTGWSFDFPEIHGPSIRTLQGVLAPSPNTNDVLQYNGTNWVNASLPEETNGIDEYDDTIAYSEGEVVWWDDRDSIYVWDSTTDSVAGTDPSESNNWKLIGAGDPANRTHPGLLKTMPELGSTHLVYYDKDEGTWAAAGTTIINNGVSPAVAYSAADNDFYRFGMDHNRFDLDKTQNNGFDIIWDIKDGGIDTDQLAGDAVTTDKIADDAVEFKQIMATRADTPADDAGKVLKVNSSGTGLEWGDDSNVSNDDIDNRIERYIDVHQEHADYTPPNADGPASIAIGDNADAGANDGNAIAIGSDAIAYDYGVALGSSASTGAHEEAVAIGFEASTSKDYDFRLGGVRQHPTINPALAGNENATNQLASVAYVNSKIAVSHEVVNAANPNAIGDTSQHTLTPYWDYSHTIQSLSRTDSGAADSYTTYQIVNTETETDGEGGIYLDGESSFLSVSSDGRLEFDGVDAFDNSTIRMTGGGVFRLTVGRQTDSQDYNGIFSARVTVGQGNDFHTIGTSGTAHFDLRTATSATHDLTISPVDSAAEYTLNKGDEVRVELHEHLLNDYNPGADESITIQFAGDYDSSLDHRLDFTIVAHAIGAALQITSAEDLVYTDSDGDTFTLIDNSVSSTSLNPAAIGDDSIAEVKLDIHNAPTAGDVLGYTANGMEWVDQDAEDYVHVNSDGTGPSGTGTEAISVGEEAVANGNRGIAIGYLASAAGGESVAIGSGETGDVTSASMASTVAIGGKAKATALEATAVGWDSNAGHANSIALGMDATTTAANQFVLGSTTAADSISAIVTPGFTGGADQYISVDANGNWSTAEVEGAPYVVINSDGGTPDVVGDDSIGIGEDSVAGEVYLLEFTFVSNLSDDGSGNTIATIDSLTINGSDASDDNSITIADGEAFQITIDGTTYDVTAVGNLPLNSTGNESLIVSGLSSADTNVINMTGNGRVARDVDDGIAIGRSSRSAGDQAIAIGLEANANQAESIALGPNTIADGQGAIAIGRDSEAIGNNSVAIGNDVVNGTANSILIGASDQTVSLGRTTSDTDGAMTVATKGYVDANLTGGAKIENFNHASSYGIGDFAVSDDRLWVALNVTLPESDWDPETDYVVGDLVYFQGQTYIADQAISGSLDRQPPDQDVAIWSVHSGNLPESDDNDDWEEVSPQRSLPSLNQITDVDTEGVSGGQILRYNSDDSEWQVKDLTLNEIDNVTVTDDSNIAEHTILQANSSNHFVERTPAQFLATGNIGELGDVSAATPVENDVLQWNATNSAWEAGAITADVSTAELSDLSDVAEDAASNGQVLTWNVTDGNGVWVPSDVPGVGGEFNFYDANAGSNTNANNGAANATAQDSLALGQYASILSQSDNATDNVIMIGGAPGAGTDGSFAGAIIGMAGQNRVFETSGNGITRFDAIDDPNGGIWYGSLVTNDLNERAKWNFDRFGALQPFNRVPSNNETFPDQYTYYTSSQSSLVGYSEGALARVIKPLSTGTTGDSAPDGFLVKMFYYDSSDNLESCTLVWVSVEADDHSDFIGLFTDGLTDVWANSDSQSGGVLEGRGSIALDPLSGNTVNQSGALTIGAWTGFDKSHTIDFAQMLGSVVYLYDSNGNLTTTRYRGRLVSDV